MQVAGCNPIPVNTHLIQAQGQTTSIVGHAGNIEDTTLTIEGNEPQKKIINKETTGIRLDAKTLMDHLNGAITGTAQLQKDLAWYKENPLVSIAVFVWEWSKWFIFGGIFVGILYVVALILGFFNPLSKPYQISQMLVRALPAANIVRWFHPQTATVPAQLMPVVSPPAVVESEANV